MLINCPECNKEISDSVKKCIHCGVKINRPKGKKSLKVILIALAICIAIATAIILIVKFTRTNKPDDVSWNAYNAGCKAIKVTDEYLDAEIDKDTAREKLDTLSMTAKKDSDYIADGLISAYISGIETGIIIEKIDYIIESRNELAEYLNLPTR